MTTIQSMKVISEPTVLVDGNAIAVVPNSVKLNIPGESSVRAMSLGGGQVQPVVGMNAEELKGKVSFSIPSTAEAIETARGWRQKTNAGEPVTIRIVDNTAQYAFQYMFMTSQVEVPFEQDGSVDLEFEGSYVE